jgi:type IV secretory pathway VirB6-like protein
LPWFRHHKITASPWNGRREGGVVLARVPIPGPPTESNLEDVLTMIRNLTTRAAVAAFVLAFAALPALADSMTPATAPTPASSASTSVAAPAAKANANLKTNAQKSHKIAQKKAVGQKQAKQGQLKQQVQATQPATGGSPAARVTGNATVNH